MNELRPVVLTGLGVITAYGDTTTHNNSGALAANTDVASNDSASQHVAIENFNLEAYLTSQKTYLDRCTALALAGCALALRDAGIEWPVDDHGIDAHCFGITMGTHLGCIETMKVFWDKAMERGVRVANPLLFSHSYFNTPISLCAIEFGLKGYHTTFCAGNGSGLEAVRAAYDAIRLGHANMILCGGVEALTPTRIQCEATATSNRLGEAAAFFILEDAESAQRRSAPIFTEVQDALFAMAANNENVRARFGDCGGAESTLSLATHLVKNTD